MGLDITAYSQLCETNLTRYNYETDDEGDMEHGVHVQFYINPHFNKHSENVKENVVYLYEQEFNFRAGSYSGYYEFRNTLAKIAGYPEHYSERRNTTDNFSYCCCIATEGPFYELINFSDCEGTIDFKISEKLYKDFVNYHDIAKEQDYFFLTTYENFMCAFEIAKNNGAVSFH